MVFGDVRVVSVKHLTSKNIKLDLLITLDIKSLFYTVYTLESLSTSFIDLEVLLIILQ